MHVLVTGGGGFIGVAVIEALLARGDTAVAFDTEVSPELARLAEAGKPVTVVRGDIGDLAHLVAAFQQTRPTAVVHCAAIIGVLHSLASPSNVLRVNVQGSLNVFEAMRLTGVPRAIHLSSEEVYGAMQPVATEDHPQMPVMSYGVSKLAVEHFGRTYRALHGIEVINLRTSWVYGIGLRRSRPPVSFLDAALEGRRLHLPWGAETAIDFAYIDDVAAGIVGALACERHPFDVYNMASGVATSLAEQVAIIRDLVPGADIAVGPGPYQHAAGVPMPSKGALDGSRARAAFGYIPKFDMRRGLAEHVRLWHERRGRR